MEPKKEISLLLKVVVVSAITAIVVFFVLVALMVFVYLQYCCEPVGIKP